MTKIRYQSFSTWEKAAEYFKDKLAIDMTLPKETAAFNITAKALALYKDNGLTGVATAYTAAKGNAKLDTMFTVYRLKGVYDKKALDKAEPLMIYLGTDGTYTYTYQIAEPEGTETDISTFADLMNSYIANLGKYITLTDAGQ